MPAVKRKSLHDPLLAHERRKSASPALAKSVFEAGAKARIHRVRFVDGGASAVTSLALSPATWDPRSSFPYAREGREVLAVGRGNGNIEIQVWIGSDGDELSKRPGTSRSQKQAWVLESTLPGTASGGGVEHLVFAHQSGLSPSDLDLISSDHELARAKEELLRTPPRLFSSSGSSTLLEWEWMGAAAGRPRATLASEGGNIWSIAVNPAGSSLAMGCEDGAIRLVNVADQEFAIVRRLDKVNTRLLSLAWGPPQRSSTDPTKGKGKERATQEGKEEREELRDVYLVAGGADSTLRKWDLQSGRCIAKLQTDVSGRDPTLVWALTVLSDHTIVSGDSMGIVKIWDGVMGTQRQSHKLHKADVLCMTCSPDERHIYSAGVDQMTSQLSLINADKSQTPDTRPQWIVTSTRRLHNHDVRAMVHSPAATGSPSSLSSSRIPILISGGVDTTISLIPAAPSGSSAMARALARLGNPISEAPSTVFDKSTQRKISFVPQRTKAVAISREARLVLAQYETSLIIWRLSRSGSSSSSLATTDDLEEGWQKCCEISLTCTTNLVASAISADGQWLAASDRYEARLFSLVPQADGTIEPKRTKMFASLLAEHPVLKGDQAASSMMFTPDSRRLILAGLTTSQLIVIRLPIVGSKSCEIVKVFSQHARTAQPGRAQASTKAVKRRSRKLNGTNGHVAVEQDSGSDIEEMQGNYTSSRIAALAVSEDGQWLASADMSRRMHVFHLDSLQHHCALPSPELVPTALGFIPLAPSQLIVGLPNNTLQIFDIESRRLAHWASSLISDPIRQLYDLREPLIGLAFEPWHSKTPSSASASPLPSPKGGSRGSQVRGSGSPAPRPRIPVVVAWSSTWICRIRLPAAMIPSASPQGSKRPVPIVDNEEVPGDLDERHALVRNEDVQVTHKYQPLLAVDFLGVGELVAVERPAFMTTAELPPAFYPAGKYGT